ncbi:potassium transporter KefB [Haloferula helveola]|uniref:Potassium transporter KefB n=1 Tax=Haloferula helveola TaxID=490095 RepID=A0ABN6H0N2_9BACT|nr:potassium transporter KefB [Haloferula helveola]
MMFDLLAAGESPITPFFGLLAMVLVLSVLVSLVLVRVKQSLLVGYFIVGVVIANSGLLWIVGADKDDPIIGNLGELGVILLMFTLGIEFSLGELRHLWRIALFGGGLQVALCGGLGALGAKLAGMPGPECAVMAVAIALSSTAVAMKSFQDMGQPNNPGARASLGIALFQDILVILFILILPAIYGSGGGSPAVEVGKALGKGVLFLGAALLIGKYGVNPLLHAVARTRSRELFTLTVIALCAAVALGGEALDLSLSLGAFAAGLVVSESIYAHRIMADVLPFKDLFLTIFFVSVGLMIDVGALLEEWLFVIAGTVLILGLKGGIVIGVTRLLKLPLRPALLAGASLSSTGEFSLVLLSKAGEFRPIDPAIEQLLLACTAVSMGLVPSLMKGAGPFGKWLEEKGWVKAHQRPPAGLAAGNVVGEMGDHAIICGYGPVGRSLNEALRRCGISTLVLELNADTVCELKRQGQPTLFADATHPEALDLAHIERARMVAFTFPAVELTVAALPLVRERNSGVCVFGRAKFPSEVARLEKLDVHVIHDEQESAVAMIRAAMGVYQRADLEDGEVKEIVEEEAEQAVVS